MTMTLNDYQVEALRTAIYPEDRGLEYTTLGLLSEVGELIDAVNNGSSDADVLSEIGDNYWYAAAIADSIGERLSSVFVFATLEETLAYQDVPTLLLLLTSYSAEIAGVVKKSIRDNDGVLSEVGYDKLMDSLANIILILDTLSRNYDATPAGVRAKNLNKLADRQRRNVLAGSGDNR